MAKQKVYTPPKHVFFVFSAGQNAHYTFSSYMDKVGALGNAGSPVFISYQLDKNKQPIPYVFGFSMRDRVIRVEENKKDVNGISVVEFLRNHPECKDSPNGTYYVDPADGVRKQEFVLFKEMNEEEDAQKALDAKNFRREAENIAANLTLEEVYEVNALLGIFKVGELMSRHAISEVAGNRPDVFMSAYQDPQRRAKAAIKKGIAKNVLQNQGLAIVWNKTMIGIDDVDAAAKLQLDIKLLEALESAIKKVS